MGGCSWTLGVRAGMDTPFVGEALRRLSGAGGRKGWGAGLCARGHGQGHRAGFPHAATWYRNQGRLRFLNSNCQDRMIEPFFQV